MDGTVNVEPLFAEFPPVSTEEWEAQIRRELNGLDYGETMLWRLPDGITLRPYYRAEDLASLEHVSHRRGSPFSTAGAWAIREDVASPSLDAAQEHIRQAKEGGADVVGILVGVGRDVASGIPVQQLGDLDLLLEGFPLTETSFHLEAGLEGPGLMAMIENVATRRDVDPENLRITLGYDPITHAARTGHHSDDTFALAAQILSDVRGRHEETRVLSAGVEAYHEAGATIVQEAALAAAAVSEFFAQMIARGSRAVDVADRLFLSVPVGSSYFAEIARLRALRLVLPQVLEPYLSGEPARYIPIHARTSRRSMTLYDPHANLVRATAQAASAVLGGCDVLVVRPFDSAAGPASSLSYRLARNVQLILRHEAYLDRVVDAAGGSYHVEVLTDAIARRAWELFREIEARGGLLASLRDGFIQTMLGRSRARRMAELAEGRAVLVGTNRFPDARESRLVDLEREAPAAEVIRRSPISNPAQGLAKLSEAVADGHTLEDLRDALEGSPRMDPNRVGGHVPAGERASLLPLPQLRDAEAFERLRLATERFERAQGRLPLVLVLATEGAAVRSDRAADALACGGFRAEVPSHVRTMNDVVHEIAVRSPDAVVLVTSDEAVRALLEGVVSALVERATPIPIGVAARPEVLGSSVRMADFLLHEEVNLADVLTELQRKLGMTDASDDSRTS